MQPVTPIVCVIPYGELEKLRKLRKFIIRYGSFQYQELKLMPHKCGAVSLIIVLEIVHFLRVFETVFQKFDVYFLVMG
jgi:hypothetical protein